MSAWYFAILLCARASAAVVETVPTAAPSASVGAAGASALGPGAASPVSLIPGGASLAPVLSPSLAPSASWSPAAIGAALGAAPSAGRVMLAPTAPAALPASAVPSAAAPSAAPSATSAGVDVLPPPPAAASASAAPIAASALTGLPISAAVLAAHDARDGSVAVVPGAAPAPRATLEEAAAAGRAFWDQSDAFGRLDDAAAAVSASFAASPAAVLAARLAPGGPSASLAPELADGSLRDAVSGGAPAPVVFFAARLAASGPPAATRGGELLPDAARAAAFAAAALPRVGAPVRAPIERLTLSLGTGLVVRVRAALGMGEFSSAARGTRRAAYALAPAAPRSAAPLTSTEWLERRGLIETAAYVPEPAAARDSSAAAPFALAAPVASAASVAPRARTPRAASRLPAGADSGSPLAWWALAFLPATLALLRDPLR